MISQYRTQKLRPLRRNDDWQDLGRWLRSSAYDHGDDSSIDATLRSLEREERINGNG